MSSAGDRSGWAARRVLVTGGAGFIGSALVWALNERGCENIVVSDHLGTDEKWRNLTPLRFADYVEADDLRSRLASGALGKFDGVLHLGACSATTERDASYLIRNNYEFTKDLATWTLSPIARRATWLPPPPPSWKPGPGLRDAAGISPGSRGRCRNSITTRLLPSAVPRSSPSADPRGSGSYPARSIR